MLANLTLQPIHGKRIAPDGALKIAPVPEEVSEKQHVGFLILLGDVLQHIRSRLVSYPGTPLDLIGGEQPTLDAQKTKGDVVDEDTEDDPTVKEDEEDEHGTKPSRALQTIH